MKLPTGENLFAAIMFISGITVVWGCIIFVLLEALPELLRR
jgi:hypothetical protein